MNLLQADFDFPSGTFRKTAFEKDLGVYIPNSYAKPPTIVGTPVRTSLMWSKIIVAGTMIRAGSEIFLDYGLGGDDDQLPPWYHHYDKAAALRRVRKEIITE